MCTRFRFRLWTEFLSTRSVLLSQFQKPHKSHATNAGTTHTELYTIYYTVDKRLTYQSDWRI